MKHLIIAVIIVLTPIIGQCQVSKNPSLIDEILSLDKCQSKQSIERENKQQIEEIKDKQEKQRKALEEMQRQINQSKIDRELGMELIKPKD
jgi:hypothetical protein